MRSRLIYFVPLVVLAVLAGYFWRGLALDPNALPSVLLDKPLPEFDLPPIEGSERGLSTADLRGEVSLVNIFGSWCVACLSEHPFLMRIKEEDLVPLHGIDWREKEPGAGAKWLARHGDPYTLIGADPDSAVAIDLGVTGAPETFVVDKEGVVRYKHVGPITPENWENTLWPLIQELRSR